MSVSQLPRGYAVQAWICDSLRTQDKDDFSKAEYLSICAPAWRKTSVVFWIDKQHENELIVMVKVPYFKQADFLKLMHVCGFTGLKNGSYTAAVSHAGRI